MKGGMEDLVGRYEDQGVCMRSFAQFNQPELSHVAPPKSQVLGSVIHECVTEGEDMNL